MQQKVLVISKMQIHLSIFARALLYTSTSSQVLLWHYSHGMNTQTGFISYFKLRTQLKRSLVQNVYVFVQSDKNLIKMTAYYNLTASFGGEKRTSKSLTSIYFI